MNTLNSSLTVIIALITALIAPIVVEWIKVNFIHKKLTKDLLGEAITVDEKIDCQLEIIMDELKCDRVCISQFHNGGHFYPTGKSIKKFSIFYERITDKATSIKEIFQNIPVSLFPKVFSTLYKNKEINIPNCKENTADCGLFPINGRDYKTKSFYVLVIEDLMGNFVGTLTVSYYGEKHELTLEEWIILRQKVGMIGSLLTDYLHDKK